MVTARKYLSIARLASPMKIFEEHPDKPWDWLGFSYNPTLQPSCDPQSKLLLGIPEGHPFRIGTCHSHEYALIFSIYDNLIKGGPVSGAKTLVTQVPTFVSSARPVNHPSRSNITRQHSLCPNAVVYDALTLSNAKKARSTRYK